MCQLSTTTVFLSLMLVMLARKIKTLERKSQQSFIKEKNMLLSSVLLFVGAYILRIIMTILQMA